MVEVAGQQGAAGTASKGYGGGERRKGMSARDDKVVAAARSLSRSGLIPLARARRVLIEKCRSPCCVRTTRGVDSRELH